MHSFLSRHRDELIARCEAKFARRLHRSAPSRPGAHGIPVFLDQLTRTLLHEQSGDAAEGLRISGPSGGDSAALSQIGVTAAAHGHELMDLGYSIDQVVHAYGDLCQAITDLAFELDAPFSVDQFRTLNRCLDNAIADAVTEFSAHRQARVSREHTDGENVRMGTLVHELRNSLQTATLAFAVLETGTVHVNGSTGALVKRSLGVLSNLLDGALGSVRAQAGTAAPRQTFALAAFIADAHGIALLGANARGCRLSVPPVDERLAVAGNRDHLLAALVNLLQNAIKFTHANTTVCLRAYEAEGRVSIDVEDRCGGLAPGFSDRMVRPFIQGGSDRSGLGLGLDIARRTIEGDGGTLSVRNVPGTGCVFIVSLPLHLP